MLLELNLAAAQCVIEWAQKFVLLLIIWANHQESVGI
jgi:hypothetical protein